MLLHVTTGQWDLPHNGFHNVYCRKTIHPSLLVFSERELTPPHSRPGPTVTPQMEAIYLNQGCSYCWGMR